VRQNGEFARVARQRRLGRPRNAAERRESTRLQEVEHSVPQGQKIEQEVEEHLVPQGRKTGPEVAGTRRRSCRIRRRRDDAEPLRTRRWLGSRAGGGEPGSRAAGNRVGVTGGVGGWRCTGEAACRLRWWWVVAG